MPVYLIHGPDGERRLVNAKTKTRAINTVVANRYTADAVGSSELVELMRSGLEVEESSSAVEEETQSDPEPEISEGPYQQEGEVQ